MIHSRFFSSTWHQALTLTERIAILNNDSDIPSPDSVEITEARSRLLRWRAEPQFETEEVWKDRLALDGIDQEKLELVLALSPEALQHLSNELDWLNWLTVGFSQPATAYATPPPGAEELFFLDLIQPLVDEACEQLFEGIDQLLAGTQDLPFDLRFIEEILLMNLPGPLLTRLSRTLVLELNIARLQGHLEGETPTERFESFIEKLREPEYALSILSDYPVLTRQLVICLSQWVEVSLEFLGRLCQDWPIIVHQFCHGTDPGKLTDLTAGAGDTHRGGRSVMIAEFESSFRLVYKPKSLAVDRHFQELLVWLNNKGFQPSLRTLEILDCGNYGWVEFIPRAECTSLLEVCRFYSRLGAYLALLYTINASDFHLENLIAMGEHPILIDLETLFNPDFEPFESGDAAAQAARAMLNSVLVVGMLPQRLWTQEAYTGIDISGFGGEAGQLSPDRVPQPDALGTDEMRYIRQRMEMSGEANRPVLEGNEVSALDHVEEIIGGFQAMYELLLNHREELLADDGPITSFGNDETRVLLRPTRTYDQLLFESFHPDVLHEALQRDLLFDRLWVVVPDRPFMAKAIASEQYDLRQGDIPVFTTKPSSLAIWNGAGERIEGILLEDGMSISQRRLESLSERDMQRQEWFIRSTLATLTPYEFGITPTPKVEYQHFNGIADFSTNRLLQFARSAADELVETAIYGQDDVAWLGLEHLGDGIWDLAPIGPGFYSGLAGISFFLAYAGDVFQNNAYTTLARTALNGVLRHTSRFSSELPEIGAFMGWGGVLYTLTHLAVLWGDQELFSAATELVHNINGLVAEDESFAIFEGAAGAILPLLGLYQVTAESYVLETATAAGDHLLATAQTMATGYGWHSPQYGPRPLLGFAHGAAGIAAALTLLGEISGRQRFEKAARQAINYERSLFSADVRNWPDLRHVPLEDEPARFLTGWCHGAVGIGLSRLQVRTVLKDPYLAGEIEAALEIVLDRGFGQNHSLCHGDMGSLDLLLAAQGLMGNQQLREQLLQKGATVLDSIDQQGWKCGGPMAVTLPGLMIGVAGIGYQMMRLAKPEHIPSVLLLEKPPAFPRHRAG